MTFPKGMVREVIKGAKKDAAEPDAGLPKAAGGHRRRSSAAAGTQAGEILDDGTAGKDCAQAVSDTANATSMGKLLYGYNGQDR